MTTRAPHTALAADWNAAREWWEEAGVDCAFLDEPQQWLAESVEKDGAPASQKESAQAPAPPPPEHPRIGGDPAGWPTGPSGFPQWWLTEPTLAPGDPALRIPPRFVEGGWLLVLVPEPEQSDRERLLSGEQGDLLDRFLAKAGEDTAKVQVVSALPRHMGQLADWRELKADGLGRVLAHQVTLAAPERILALGRPVVELLGDAIGGEGTLTVGDRQMPLLTGRSLDVLVTRPQQRKGLWENWHKWMGKDVP
jgi:DNA polymerase